MLLDIVLLVLGAVLLWFGAGWVVESSAAVARRLNISELVIGLTVVAMGTSAPEFFVTAQSAFKGLPAISLANVVGSDIFNLGIILGAMAILKPIPTHRTILYRDGVMLWAVVGVLLLMCTQGALTRPMGLGLLVIFGGYVALLVYKGIRDPGPMDIAMAEELLEEAGDRVATWIDGPKLIIGFAAITLGSDWLVEGARVVAAALGVSDWAIGLTVVAAGTSLPELVTCLAASLRGKNDMLLGNLIGSDFFNLAGVLGLTAVLRPISVDPTSLPSLGLMVGAVALVLLFMRTGWRISRLEGALLVLVGLGRWALGFV
ncbi:calcium/sodium antiporter [Oceanidesulfovibrio marinus]|uniref:Sodium:calcium antiporter n=1 Tax=Oceanidesulfovibrio marinus TaxID=370038 RepID=A0A6P1ZI59_9BACT|nr:calcium/sodium antiporter [Oceanidesulfovibrio marinus]TVM34714.1 sodium:calcium antiporter [Oceanidesulfovibrio marinus]